jgi:DNA-binding LacI/PurR family transcriptional regulator
MVRIMDIMKETGLSRVTVSGVLNGRQEVLGISDATAERVRATAKRLGYIRNDLSLAVRSGKSYTFGCIISALDQEWGGRLLEGALVRLLKTPYAIRISSAEGFEDETAALEHIIAGRVAGLFVSNVNPPVENIQKIHSMLARYGIPIVSNNCPAQFSKWRVEADDVAAGYLACKHLLDHGHRHIAFISGLDHPTSNMRLKGFRLAMQESGNTMRSEWIKEGDWQLELSEKRTRELLSTGGETPTAILAANHVMAAGVLREAARLGVDVPNQLSVIGVTDDLLCEITSPPMTTVCVNENEIGSRAMELLIERAEQSDAGAAEQERLELVPVTLKQRGSVGSA